MTQEEKQKIWNCADNEGFDYCFCYYSGFKEVKDEKFHKLREAYKAAKKALQEYINPEDHE